MEEFKQEKIWDHLKNTGFKILRFTKAVQLSFAWYLGLHFRNQTNFSVSFQ